VQGDHSSSSEATSLREAIKSYETKVEEIMRSYAVEMQKRVNVEQKAEESLAVQGKAQMDEKLKEDSKKTKALKLA